MAKIKPKANMEITLTATTDFNNLILLNNLDFLNRRIVVFPILVTMKGALTQYDPFLTI